MNKWQWKVFSMTTILALALALCPPAAVNAASGDGTITGQIAMAQPENNPGAKFNVDAYPVGGGDGNCSSNGPVTYDTDHYNYTLTGCDSEKDYTVVAQGSGYTFNSVTVLSTDFVSFTAPAPDITPVERVFSGTVTKPNGDPWVGFVLHYKLNAVGELDPMLTATTNSSGIYTIPDVTDASLLYFPRIDMDGYDFGGGEWWYKPPLQNDITDANFTSRGTRNINGRIESMNSNQGCVAGVTITVSATGALTQTALTSGDSGFHLNNLEPLNTYVVTPTRPGCVFKPASQTIDITNGDLNHEIVFQVPNTGVWGNVKTNLGEDVSLAYYLIATYTTSEGVSYSNSVNWADGSYWIQVPPNIGGTLTISRIGGPAAFGYQTAGATHTGITLTDTWSEQNFTLVPSRTISGTIKDQNGVPVQKNATVDFGYWLHWTQPNTPVTTYSIKAQPKLYYLSPVENGIASSSPLRFLANLTTAPAVTNANFTLNLKTYLLDGCLRRDNNDSMVLPAGSVRFRPAALYGATLYPASLTADDMQNCGLNNVYYGVRLPKGMVGALEADNHTVRASTIDGMTSDMRLDFSVFGNRAITGRIYSPNLNLDKVNNDFGGNGILVLRDAATNDLIQTNGDMERSFEFSLPMLESKVYTLSINPDRIPDGYDANPFPMSPIVTANLVAGDVDIPAASGFVLVHKPIDPASATGGGYFQADGTEQTVSWAWPPMNDNDKKQLKGFDVQVGTATTSFTDTSPAPVFYQPNGGPTYEFTGLIDGVLYRWRARVVFETDKGPWMETAPRPTAPANNAGYMFLNPTAGPVTFIWNEVAPENYSGLALKYVVQYSSAPNFVSGTTMTLDAVVGGTSKQTPAVISRAYTNDPLAGSNIVLNMASTTGFKVGNFVIVSSSAGSENTTIIAVTSTTITVAKLVIDHTITSRLVTSPGPTIGTTYYWRVKVQNSATPAVDISGWSPIQVFFNRYKNLTGVSYQQDTFVGWSPEPIRFFAASPITNILPANAYYQVQISTDDFATIYRNWTFTRTANITTPSARQFLGDLSSGDYEYYWRIRIVYGNDSYATLITDWTDGASNITFTVP